MYSEYDVCIVFHTFETGYPREWIDGWDDQTGAEEWPGGKLCGSCE